MGFPRNHAVLALRAKGGDVARSIDWLLSGGGGNLPPPDDSDPSAAAGGGGRGGSSSVRVARGVGARKAKPRPGRSVPLAGTARAVSGSEYQACASEEGAKHHATLLRNTARHNLQQHRQQALHQHHQQQSLTGTRRRYHNHRQPCKQSHITTQHNLGEELREQYRPQAPQTEKPRNQFQLTSQHYLGEEPHNQYQT